MRFGEKAAWRRLLAAVLTLAVVALNAAAAPRGPVSLADALQLDPAAICHAGTDAATPDAAGQAHDCCIACQLAMDDAAAVPPARPAIRRGVALSLPGAAAPAPPPAASAYTPRGPPLSV